MKKIIPILLVLCVLVCSFAGCNKEEGAKPKDISDEVQHSEIDGQIILTGFDGAHKNIIIPDSVNGAEVTMLSPSFANGKNIESVELPGRIDAFIRQDNGLYLCASSVPNSVALNKGNAAAVYCEFFNVDSVTVNGVDYSKNALPDPQNPDLSGEWKNTDIINGVRYTQVYTFADGKVTCTSDSDVFEGTYEIKDGKLLVTLDDVTAEFEFVGDQLICWEHNINLSTKDMEDYAETSDTGWSYIVTPGGYAQLVGYHGNESNVTIPRDIDGYEVNSINSSVADTYNFTKLNYTGHGGARFANVFSYLHYDQETDNYILYSSDAGDESYVMGLRHRDNWTTTEVYDMSAEAYCRVFGQSSIIIDDVEYTHTTVDLTAEQVVGLWEVGSDQYTLDTSVSLYEDGVAEVHYAEDGVCKECVSGQYTVSGSRVFITLPKGTMILDAVGRYMICWDGNNWVSGQSPFAIVLDFQKTTREGEDYLIAPFYHFSDYILKDTFAWEDYGTNPYSLNYLTFEENGSGVVTLVYLDWYDKQVQYALEGDTITITDGTTTEVLTIEDYRVIDGIGNRYYPSWARG